MFINVFPLQTILFQSLFLLVAIAVEGFILHKQLNLTRKTSIEYATSINLFTTILGWVGFFYFYPLLPKGLKAQVVSYIFFDRFLDYQDNSIIILAAIGTFFVNFFTKFQALRLLEILLEVPTAISQQARKSLFGKNQGSVSNLSGSNSSQASVILLATACSHSVILLILVLRLLK